MKSFLKTILDELKILEENSKKDESEKKYDAYEHYVKEYNQILMKLKSSGYYESTPLIKNVPDEKKAAFGIGSTAEIAKHKEVILETQKLIKKVEDKLGIKPKREGEVTNKASRWCIFPLIGLILTIIGGAYLFGKDNGYSKFDKEKRTYADENIQFKKDADSLKVSYTTLLKLSDSLQKKLELYEKLDETSQK
ncbi:MAG: hypothetical protein FWD47_12350 [Treponema sp.]|nr:hypothetical protein [Treponema sp.]